MKTDHSLRLTAKLTNFERHVPVANPELITIEFNEIMAIVSQAMCRSVQPNLYNQMWTKLNQEARPILLELQLGQSGLGERLCEKVKEVCRSATVSP